MNFSIYLLILPLFLGNAAEHGTYKAAVVEYAPKLTAEKPVDQLLDNVKEYKKYIEQAADQGVQIIVFPEDGLTGWSIINDNTIYELSTEVPDPIHQISPCTARGTSYSKAFIDFSCSARTHKIYLVVNLIERRYDYNTSKLIYHNTNVVFDRNGSIIARYRKINLFNEDIFLAGTQPATFKTDFGVTFAVIICFDIMFANPGLDVLLNPEVTDIVYSAAWFSEIPFLQSLSAHHGYVKTNGVNLLSSGMHDPSTSNGGSGIYLADGKIAKSYISGIKDSSRMLVQDVPIIKERTPLPLCELETPTPGVFQPTKDNTIDEVSDITNFVPIQENMTHYTFKSIDLNQKVISDTICNEESELCCSFNITVNKDPTSKPNYVYKLAAFDGARLIALNGSIGVRNCGLVACLNESNSSCGLRHKEGPKAVTFESISVKGTFKSQNSYDQPATLKFDLTPITGYLFCKRRINEEIEVTLSKTGLQNSLLTFGIYGRVFSNDNKPIGVIPTTAWA